MPFNFCRFIIRRFPIFVDFHCFNSWKLDTVVFEYLQVKYLQISHSQRCTRLSLLSDAL